MNKMEQERDIFFNIVAVLLGAALIATFFGMGYILGKTSGNDAMMELAQERYVENIQVEADDPFLGDPNAPVTIVEFSDYECPFCARHFAQSHKQLVEEYVKTGKVKLVYKDFPLSFHPNAVTAAVAAECAYDQGSNEMYFEMHDIIFGKHLENAGAPTRDNLITWAEEIEGLDVSRLTECIDNNETIDRVNRDVKYATEIGVEATPSFFINGRFIEGAQPYGTIQSVIDEELDAF